MTNGIVTNGNNSGQNVGFETTAEINGLIASGSVTGSFTNSDGSTRTFQCNVLAPSVAVLYPDGMIVFSWNPEERGFEISFVIDSEGNKIKFENGKLAIDKNQSYTVSPVNADLWQAIISYMGIRTAGDRALFMKLKNLKQGIVIICGGAGFPPCGST